MRIVHLSWLKRSDGELGGVEKFAYYLSKALVEGGHECLVVGWNDYPNAERVASAPNPDKALLLGAWAESELEFDVCVADGYWGAGVTQHPVVPVVHGTWAQFWLNMGYSPWTNAEVQAQHQAFNAVNAHPVACSHASERELIAHHRRTPTAVILHGIDLDLFRPRRFGHNGLPVVLHAATNDKKGKALIPTIARLLPDFDVKYLGAQVGEEAEHFQRGDIFLQPTKHEGNAYALLEALATGLPVVTSSVGLFEDIKDPDTILPISTTAKGWADAVRFVWGDGQTPYREYAGRARRLAQQVADYERFKDEWLDLLTGL